MYLRYYLSMKYEILRRKLRLKRELLKKIGYKPGNFISINREEKKPIKFAQKLKNYSAIVSQEIYDPRSERYVGHTFNSRDVFKLNDVILEPKQGAIYSLDGKLISESTNWSTSNFYESFPWNPKKITAKVNRSEVINLTSNSYGHWVAEDLGSILYLIENFPSSPILIYKNSPRYVHELLKKLNREVILCTGPVKVNSILMVTKQNDSGWFHPKDMEILNKFSDQVRGSKVESIERIYATRRFLKRSPKNERDIENLFKSYNFTILRLEEMNFIDEINLMHSTKIIAGVHGSWIFNSIWMDKGTMVFDIVNENYWTELNHRYCAVQNIDYKYFVYSGNVNNYVNVNDLEITLNKILNN
jgi:hypothetical protein